MKKLIGILLSVACVLSLLAGCGGAKSSNDAKLKIGVILVGDENEGYTAAHIDGIKEAINELGYGEDDVQVIWKYKIGEDETCYDTATDLVEQGCNVVFANSYGHQQYVKQAAEENKDVTFVSVTGDQAKTSGLDNLCNAFTSVYQSRYVSGVVAGMKIKELADGGKLKDNNYKDGKVKVGYVGAFPYAEVVSGYTAFFLGIQSIYPDVTMDVTYTNSWFSITDEGAAAEQLASTGCVVIGQHADSTGAPSAIQALHAKGQEVYSVGYNVDMLNVAADAALTSATNNWGVYYKYAIAAAYEGKKIDQNWAEGYETDAVAITKLGSACAAGTQEKVDAAIAGLKNGSVNVFDCSKFTVKGANLTEYKADIDGDFKGDTNVVENGIFHESDAKQFRSAPYFDIRIDGINELSNDSSK